MVRGPRFKKTSFGAQSILNNIILKIYLVILRYRIISISTPWITF